MSKTWQFFSLTFGHNSVSQIIIKCDRWKCNSKLEKVIKKCGCKIIIQSSPGIASCGEIILDPATDITKCHSESYNN